LSFADCSASCESSPAYGSIRQHTSAYVSIRRHTSEYVSRSTRFAGCSASCESSPPAAFTTQFTFFTGTNVQILMSEELRIVAACCLYYSVNLLYWYKSTNTNTPADCPAIIAAACAVAWHAAPQASVFALLYQ
jgi:hypothetical protein